MSSVVRRWWPAALVALVVIAIDQISKAIVRAEIEPGTSVNLIDGTLRLVQARNSGIAGGMLAGQSTALIILVSMGAVAGLLVAARWLGPRRWLWLPLGLILGGALGNLIDRFAAGEVTDFIVFRNGGPANLADQAITLGVIGLLLVAWLSKPQSEPESAPDPTPVTD